MNELESIRQELAKAATRKKELGEKLRQLEETEPDNFHQIWMLRDQIAYWEGKSEGLQFALDQLER
jgi:antitoxin component of MazEF toxin-antitoxin module